jgi:hypothetical protein
MSTAASIRWQQKMKLAGCCMKCGNPRERLACLCDKCNRKDLTRRRIKSLRKQAAAVGFALTPAIEFHVEDEPKHVEPKRIVLHAENGKIASMAVRTVGDPTQFLIRREDALLLIVKIAQWLRKE